MYVPQEIGNCCSTKMPWHETTVLSPTTRRIVHYKSFIHRQHPTKCCIAVWLLTILMFCCFFFVTSNLTISEFMSGILVTSFFHFLRSIDFSFPTGIGGSWHLRGLLTSAPASYHNLFNILISSQDHPYFILPILLVQHDSQGKLVNLKLW